MPGRTVWPWIQHSLQRGLVCKGHPSLPGASVEFEGDLGHGDVGYKSEKWSHRRARGFTHSMSSVQAEASDTNSYGLLFVL